MPSQAIPAPISFNPYAAALPLCLLSVMALLYHAFSAGDHHFPIFHSIHPLLESLSVAASFSIALMSWFRTETGGRYRIFAVGFFAVAMLDVLHLLSYPGMPPLITANSPHKAIVFWLAARWVMWVTILAVLLPIRWHAWSVALLSAFSVAAAMIGLWVPDWLPPFFVEGSGVTPLKIGLEWPVCIAFLLMAAMGYRQRERLREKMPIDWLVAGLLILGFGELLFVFYRSVDSFNNGLGHLLKILGQGFLLYAVLEARLLRPYRAMLIAQSERAKALARMNGLVAAAPLGILVVDDAGRIRTSNPAAERLFRAEPGGLDGLAVEALVPDVQRERHIAQRERYRKQPDARGMSERTDLEALRRDGTQFFVSVALAPLEWGGANHTLAFVSDVNLQVSHLQRLRWLALHDELTGLPNRRAAEELLEQRLEIGRGSVIVLGLDALQRVNQVFGHEVGDRLLQATAARLESRLEAGETLTRLQSDTFLVILPGAADVAERARVLIAAFSESVTLADDIRLHISVTGGYARFPEDGNNASQLLQNAELAMASAKRTQRHGVSGFDASQPTRARRWLDLASQMPGDLAAGQFHLVYQPRIALGEKQLAGFEVLLRWRSAGVMVSPAEFIPVAEDTGFILELGRFVIDSALSQAAAWLAEGIAFGRLAINLSPRQLADTSLPDFLADALARHRVPPELVELEITETAAMENLDWALPRLQVLSALGLAIALDDFGTGYSSLSYLQSLPLSILKIDASFVWRLDSEAGRVVARTIIVLARSLGLRTVAEGVETEAQRDWLVSEGCDEMQGYLEARPMTCQEAEAYLCRRALPVGRLAAT